MMKLFEMGSMDDNSTFEKAQRELLKKTEENIVEQLRLLEPNAPDDVLHAFARVYFDFELSCNYDLESGGFVITVNPTWKSPDMIYTESEDFKVLDKYIMNGLKESKDD